MISLAITSHETQPRYPMAGSVVDHGDDDSGERVRDIDF